MAGEKGTVLDPEEIVARKAQERSEAQAKEHEAALEEQRREQEAIRAERKKALADSVPDRERLRLIRRQLIMRGEDVADIPVINGAPHEGSNVLVDELADVSVKGLRADAKTIAERLEEEEANA